MKSARSRFRVWLESRSPRSDTLVLTQRNVYILPTRAGWMFAATLIVLLLASINYQLSLGYMLTFLLVGSGVVSMHITHATLAGLTLHLKPTAPSHAQDPAVLDLVLTSPGSVRFGIGIQVAGARTETRAWVNVPGGGQTTAQVSFVPEQRGHQEAPALTAETRFSLGLFRAWAVWRPASRLWVYPQLERPAPALPVARAVPGGASTSRAAAGGEVEGVRAYQRGDPLKLVAWKQAAKTLESTGELVSRDTSTASHQELWLDWQACAPLSPEERLSRLAAWTLLAHRADTAFGLRLPGLELPPADGEAQRRRCLEALALWR